MCWSCNTRTVLVRPAISRARENAREQDDPRLIGSSVPISQRAIWRPGRARRRDTIQQKRSGVSPPAAVTVRRRGKSGRRGRFAHAPARRRMARRINRFRFRYLRLCARGSARKA
jgi:hypothetical protein